MSIKNILTEYISKTTSLSIHEMSPFTKKIFNWASGSWVPVSKKDEDLFLTEASNLISKNCQKNPGQLGEWVVKEKLKLLNSKNINSGNIICSWLIGQTNIQPDVILENYIIEVKTLKYYNSKGKRGNQGTSSEKIDSIFRKYSNVYSECNKHIIIILVADQQFEKNGKMYLDAFNHTNYNNNLMLKKVVPFYKNTLKFNMVGFNSISEHILFNNEDVNIY